MGKPCMGRLCALAVHVGRYKDGVTVERDWYCGIKRMQGGIAQVVEVEEVDEEEAE